MRKGTGYPLGCLSSSKAKWCKDTKFTLEEGSYPAANLRRSVHIWNKFTTSQDILKQHKLGWREGERSGGLLTIQAYQFHPISDVSAQAGN